MTRLDTIHFNDRTLTWVGGAALLSVLIAGIAPAFWTVRSALFSRLRGTGIDDSSSPRAQVGRQVLVAAQLAFALLVTVSRSLLVHTMQQLQTADLGFLPAKLSVAQVPLVGSAYRRSRTALADVRRARHSRAGMLRVSPPRRQCCSDRSRERTDGTRRLRGGSTSGRSGREPRPPSRGRGAQLLLDAWRVDHSWPRVQ